MKAATIIAALVLIVGFAAPTMAQQATTRAPDCLISFSFTAAGSVGGNNGAQQFDNRQGRCTVWTITYQSSGFSAVSLQWDGANDATGGVPGTFAVWPTVVVGALPLTTTTYSSATGTGYAPWIRVTLNSKTGTGRIYGTLLGWVNTTGSTTGGGGAVTQGTSPWVISGAVNISDSAGNAITANTDTCDGVLATRVAISQTADTTVITASSGQRNDICAFLLVVNNSAGATETVNVIEGTGAGCVTTQTAAIIGSTTEASGMVVTSNGIAGNRTLQGSGTNVNTCVMQVGTQRIAGYLLYVQVTP